MSRFAPARHPFFVGWLVRKNWLTAVIAGFVVSLTGGSRVQVAGPTAAFIPIVLPIVSEHGYGGLHLVTAMAATALNALESVVKRHHGEVVLSGIHQQPLQMLHRAGFIEVIGRSNFCATFDEALERASRILAENP